MSKYIIISVLLASRFVFAADYTNGKNVPNACHLFATDAEHAATIYNGDINLKEILIIIGAAPFSDSMKDRVQQAFVYVWENQIDNPVMAYSLAMGVCLSPKKSIAPLDDISMTPYRISRHPF